MMKTCFDAVHCQIRRIIFVAGEWIVMLGAFDSAETVATCLRMERGINFGTHVFFDGMTRLCAARDGLRCFGGYELLRTKRF
jgi:hypothetical protein